MGEDSYLELKLDGYESSYRDKVKKMFYDKNDGAHQIDHIDNVWKEFVMLYNRHNESYGIIADRNVVFHAVYTHDIFSGSDRAIHNSKAAEYVKDLDDQHNFAFLSGMAQADKDLIAKIIYWHRSSLIFNIKEFNEHEGFLIMIMRAADKGAPIFDEWLERSMKYHKGDKNTVENVKQHFIEKFSEDGYAWKNDPTYKKLYEDEYNVFQRDLKIWLKTV